MRHVVLALTLILSAAGIAAAQGTDPAPVRTTPFPDVPRDHWAFDAVESLRQKGIIRGYPPSQTFGRARRTVAKSQPVKRGERRTR